MANGTIKARQTSGTATRTAGTDGILFWVKQGSVVTVTGNIRITSNISHGTSLFSGLPIPKTGYIPVPVHNSTTGYHFSSYVMENGDIKNSEQWAASAWFNFSGSYIAST